MRITYLHQYFNTPAQSGGTRSYEMARRLVARGHQVTMITSDRAGQGSRVREEMMEGIKVLWIPVAYDNSMSYARRMMAFAAFAIRSARLASQQPCDIIFATSTPLTIAIPAMYAAWRRRVPWVLEVRDLWPEVPVAIGALRNPLAKGAATWLARRAYASARHLVALSPGMKAEIIASGVPDKKVTVIPNCSDLDRFDPAKADPNRFLALCPWLAGRRLALYAGQIGKINGLEYLVDLAVEISPAMPEVAIVLLGRGSERAKVAAYAKARGVFEKSLFVLEPLPKVQMPHAFAAADVALGIFKDVPYMDTNSSNKFFDALAAGKPIAINYGGWQAEVIREFRNGVVLPANDPTIGASQLMALLTNRDAVAAAGLASRQVAKQCFDLSRLASELESILACAAISRRT
jgi:glycosyltransferase involved in cell wall biosynthesis